MEIRECLAGLLVSRAEGRFSGVAGDGEGDDEGLSYLDFFCCVLSSEVFGAGRMVLGCFAITAAVAYLLRPDRLSRDSAALHFDTLGFAWWRS